MMEGVLVTVEDVLCPEDRYEDVATRCVLRNPRDPLGGGAQPEGDLCSVVRGHAAITGCDLSLRGCYIIVSGGVVMSLHHCLRRCCHVERLSLTEIHLWPTLGCLWPESSYKSRPQPPPHTHTDTGAQRI